MRRDLFVMNPLRWILLGGVLICLAFVLTGCATPGVMCDMRDTYDSETPVPASGDVYLHWRPYEEGHCVGGTYGCTNCVYGNCTFWLKRQPPSFSDVCQLARFAHEELHGMGKKHVPN